MGDELLRENFPSEEKRDEPSREYTIRLINVYVCHKLAGRLSRQFYKCSAERRDGGEAALLGNVFQGVFGVFLKHRDAHTLYAQLVYVVVERLSAHLTEVVADVCAVCLQFPRQVGKCQVLIHVQLLLLHHTFQHSFLYHRHAAILLVGRLLRELLHWDGVEVPAVAQHHSPQYKC